MQPYSTKLALKVKREEENSLHSSLPDHLDDAVQESIDLISSEEEEENSGVDEDDQSNEDAQKQLVIYDPSANVVSEIEPVPDLNKYQTPPPRRNSIRLHSSRVLPSVGAFTVQCAGCFKWRLIPTKEKYEEIREHILENPFFCETAREWRPEISCDDPPDISQDGSRLWAIDKPNIAQPPPGWQRLLRIRGEGSTRFADVYYVAPSGKRLRSTVEVQKYLLEHPEHMEEGVTLAKFSFQVPKPLQQNYVRKRPARLTASQPSDANPLAWAGPNENTVLRLGGPGLSPPLLEAPPSAPTTQPAKKKAKRTPTKEISGDGSTYDQPNIKMQNPFQARSGGSLDL
ncbi:hypothetical protein NMG60_11023833 [Bertholletia excelsa]